MTAFDMAQMLRDGHTLPDIAVTFVLSARTVQEPRPHQRVVMAHRPTTRHLRLRTRPATSRTPDRISRPTLGF